MHPLINAGKANTPAMPPPGQPPTDEKPSELFMRFSQQGTCSEVVDFEIRPGNVCKVRIKLLTFQEQEAAKITAYQYLKAKNVDGNEFQSLLKETTCVEVLHRCVCDPEPVDLGNGNKIFTPVFINSDLVRQNLSPDQIVRLFNLFTLVQARFGVNDNAVFVANNFELWVEKLAEGAEYFPLSDLPLDLLAEAMAQMAKIIVSNSLLYPSSQSPNTSESPQPNADGENSSSGSPAESSSTPQLTRVEANRQARQEASQKKTHSTTHEPELMTKEQASRIAKK